MAYGLLNSLASDLDFMLNDLCTTPPPPPPPPLPLSPSNFENGRNSHSSSVGSDDVRGEVFLEHYMQGLAANVEETVPAGKRLSRRSLVVVTDRSSSSNPSPEKQSPSEQQSGVANGRPNRLAVHQQDNDEPSSTSLLLHPPHLSSLLHFEKVEGGGEGRLTQADESTAKSVTSSEDGSNDGYGPPCDINVLERLIRTHHIWYLPGIQRSGAVHLLQGKEEGNFIVRQSSKSDTMAISVRLPPDKGPYIQHYLIQAVEGVICLESSDNRFDNIPSLIAHYCQCCDELPVQLTLPRAVREAQTRQQLRSYGLLGQEFWGYPMANPKPVTSDVAQTPTTSTFTTFGIESQASHSSQSSLSSMTSPDTKKTPPDVPHRSSGKFPPVIPPRTPVVDIPAMVAPDTCKSIILNLVPLEHSSMSTFKSQIQKSPLTEQPPDKDDATRHTRPTPPNTLNLSSTTVANLCSPLAAGSPRSKSTTPPPPPPRWSKPVLNSQNFTVTTTLTFTLNQANAIKSGSTPVNSPCVEVSSVQITPNSNKKGESVLSPISPASDGQLNRSQLRSGRREKKPKKESQHYQESDILDSPPLYYRSSVADKVSDYEDIWGTSPRATPERNTDNKPELLTFKPSGDDNLARRMPNKPDLLEKVSNAINSSTLSLTSPVSDTVLHNNRLNQAENEKSFSPFYAEPADAIKQQPIHAVLKRRERLHSSPFQRFASHRHSDPNIRWPPAALARESKLERIDSNDELHNLSSSVDNLMAINKPAKRPLPLLRGKPVQPPVVGSENMRPHNKGDASWAVDSSWEFIGNDNEVNGNSSPREQKFPPLSEEGMTVENIIVQKLPDLKLRHEKPPSTRCEETMSYRRSAYDNLEEGTKKEYASSVASDDDARTEFSEPWDSSRWEQLLRQVNDSTDQIDQLRRNSANNNAPHQKARNGDIDSSCPSLNQPDNTRAVLSDTDSVVHAVPGITATDDDDDETSSVSEIPSGTVSLQRNKSFKEKMDPLLSPLRLQSFRNHQSWKMGASIREYAFHLAELKSTTFAQNIDNFIQCTRESKETSPQIVIRNVRQFMSGMKNYLVKHGEQEFDIIVEKERSKLKQNEFLNLDAILEGVMHKVVVQPLREHIYKQFVDEYTHNGSIQLLADNIKFAQTKTLTEFGIKAEFTPPSNPAMELIKNYLAKLQEVYSPLEKLENLLAAISTIFNTVQQKGKSNISMGADDFLPMFVYILVQCGMVSAEIEADYMWGLLQPSLLSGEGGYYLTTLSSAVHVLKNFKKCYEESGNDVHNSCVNNTHSMMKIIIPDETNGSILTKTVPMRPNMTTKEVVKIITHKLRITNPQDYGLYKLLAGEETLLGDNEFPQVIRTKLSDRGRQCTFAYKRMDAKIAWPRTS